MGTWYLVSTVQWKHKIIEVLWFELCEWRYGGWLFAHCLKKGQHCEAGRQKLSILVDESDAVNPFIYPSDEEDANEEMNLIKEKIRNFVVLYRFVVL